MSELYNFLTEKRTYFSRVSFWIWCDVWWWNWVDDLDDDVYFDWGWLMILHHYWTMMMTSIPGWIWMDDAMAGEQHFLFFFSFFLFFSFKCFVWIHTNQTTMFPPHWASSTQHLKQLPLPPTPPTTEPYNSNRNQSFKMMQMGTWFTNPAIFFIIDVRDIFQKYKKYQISKFSQTIVGFNLVFI